MNLPEKLKLKPLPDGLSKAISKCPLIISLGPSAWPRLVPSFYFPKYKIMTFYDCQDNDFIEKSGVEVFSLKKKDPELEVSPVTPGQILQTKIAQEFLNKQKEHFVFLVYKSSFVLEELCREKGWQVIANRKEIASIYEDKRIFKEILKKIGLEAIPGDNILIEDLTEEKLLAYQKKFGQKKLVLQMAEMTYGGGSGTLFLDNPQGLPLFFERVAELRKNLEGKKKKIETVNISPYIQGQAASISCCVTRFGILTGPVQTQLIDMEVVGTKLKNRSGNHAGHDWSFRHYSAKSQAQADHLAKHFGQYIFERGYRGIFGLDLIIEKNGKVWPVECNPRETDAFPLISFLMMDKGLIPFDVFHNLELLGLDYDFDFKKCNQGYKQAFEASQIILHNPLNQEAVARKVLQAGIHRLESNQLTYLRPGFQLADLQDENELLLMEGLLKESGKFYEPNGRLFRLVKKGGLLSAGGNNLKPSVKKAIKIIYDQLDLLLVKRGLRKQGELNILSVPKFIGLEKEPDLKKADLIDVIGRASGGFYRPLKIAWRKEITNEPMINQIRSKRAQKQIKSDLKRLSQLGIEIKTLPEINQELFEEWLALYQKIIKGKKGGHLVIGKGWLKEKIKKGKKVGAVLAFKGNKIIGGNLFFEIAGRLCVGYGVSEKIEKLMGGLALLLDYQFLVYAQQKGYKEISFGQDTNLYGADLSSGLLLYKSKLGFSPVSANKIYWVTTFFQNFDKFEDEIYFFTGEKDLTLNVILKQKENFQPYLPLGIDKFNVFSQKEVKFYGNRK